MPPGSNDCWNCGTAVADPQKPKCLCGHKWQLLLGDKACNCGACRYKRGEKPRQSSRAPLVMIVTDGRYLAGWWSPFFAWTLVLRNELVHREDADGKPDLIPRGLPSVPGHGESSPLSLCPLFIETTLAQQIAERVFFGIYCLKWNYFSTPFFAQTSSKLLSP